MCDLYPLFFEKGINFETVSCFTGLPAPTLRTQYGHFAKADCALLNLAYDFSKFAAATMPKSINLPILGAEGHDYAVYGIADWLQCHGGELHALRSRLGGDEVLYHSYTDGCGELRNCKAIDTLKI